MLWASFVKNFENWRNLEPILCVQNVENYGLNINITIFNSLKFFYNPSLESFACVIY